MFWFLALIGLSLWLNAGPGSSERNAMVLVGSWLAFVILAPALTNLAATTVFAAPSRVHLTTELREATDAADKEAELNALLARTGVAAERAACLVDDLPDLPMMRMVGLPAAVADAHPQVLAAARHVTTLPGRQGAVREFCDWLMAGRDSPP